MSREVVAGLVSLGRETGIWLVADETYARLVFEPAEHVSPLALAAPEERVVSLGSCSKTYSMPEWRIGWALVPERLRRPVEAAVFATTGTLSAVSQHAALVALATPAAELEERRARYRRRRDAALAALADAEGIRPLPPDATFFLLVDVRERGLGSEQAAEVLRRRGLAVAPGTWFGPDGEGYLRVSLVLPARRLEDALEALARPW
jgi:arginine:pyruvate transaminase